MPSATAQSISPLRIVVTPVNGKAHLTISNPNEENRTIHLGWADLTALTNGTYRQSTVTERQNRSAAAFMTVGPAYFQLSPGESRRVSIAVRTEQAPQHVGEKRSHLVVKMTHSNSPARKAAANLHLDIQRAVSVPVILRSGDIKAAGNSARIEDVKLRRLPDGGLALDVLLARNGSHSLYGKLTVEGILHKNGRSQIIAEQNNIALYAENTNRLVSFNLGLSRLPESAVSVTFEGIGEYAGNTFARRLFSVRAPE
ncbi:hypothetical protein [Parvularcula sp. IMCC14364]|uniref:hypothetical protein n=1 Tax=Parvularcula sp. IMCC14364 TaxID=3067902 RepID=UPI002741EE16|nr:hypothetical protein [Parvularcula sp. IMCC14364]